MRRPNVYYKRLSLIIFQQQVRLFYMCNINCLAWDTTLTWCMSLFILDDMYIRYSYRAESLFQTSYYIFNHKWYNIHQYVLCNSNVTLQIIQQKYNVNCKGIFSIIYIVCVWAFWYVKDFLNTHTHTQKSGCINPLHGFDPIITSPPFHIPVITIESLGYTYLMVINNKN